MGDHLGVKLSGVDELLEAFDAIGVIGEKQAMTAAAKKALRPMQQEAMALAPMSGEFDGDAPLAYSIKIRTRLPKSQKRKRGGRKHPVEVFLIAEHPVAHLMEWGFMLKKRVPGSETGPKGPRGGRAKRATYVVRHVPARPFMRPAFDSTKKRTVALLFQHVGKEVDKVAKRYVRQAEKGKLSRGAKRAFKVAI